MFSNSNQRPSLSSPVRGDCSCLLLAAILASILSLCVGVKPSLAQDDPKIALRLMGVISRQKFESESNHNRYGQLYLIGARLAIDLDQKVEPYFGLSYGQANGDHPDRLKAVIGEMGMRINIIHNWPIRLFLGGGFSLVNELRRMRYSSYFLSDVTVREYKTSQWRKHLSVSSEYALIENGVYCGAELDYSWAGQMGSNVGTRPGTVLLTGPATRLYIGWRQDSQLTQAVRRSRSVPESCEQ